MNEIISAIVGAVVTGFIGLIAYYYKTHQGNRVVVKRISETPQIEISRRVKRKLEITYDGKPVDNLVLNTLVIFNNSNETIEPVEIDLTVNPQDQAFSFLEVEVDDPLDKTAILMEEKGFTFNRPYLNPKKKFKEEEIRLAVFSNTRLGFYIGGGGKGWYARFEEAQYIPRLSRREYSLVNLALFALIGFISSLKYRGTILFYLGSIFGVIGMVALIVSIRNIIRLVINSRQINQTIRQKNP